MLESKLGRCTPHFSAHSLYGDDSSVLAKPRVFEHCSTLGSIKEAMSSPKGGEDLFPALESLSRLIVPHIKTVIFVALVVNQLPVLPDLQTILQSQFSSPLIFIVALYFGSIWTLPNGEDNNNAFSWATLLGPFYAFQTVTEQVGTYIKGRVP